MTALIVSFGEQENNKVLSYSPKPTLPVRMRMLLLYYLLMFYLLFHHIIKGVNKKQQKDHTISGKRGTHSAT